MLQDINPHGLQDMSFEELMELTEREQINIGNATSKNGLITKINNALREAGIDISAKPEEKQEKELVVNKIPDNPNDLNSVPRRMLELCKNSPVKKVFCPDIYATIFGHEYTFLLNCVPVTVKFNGTEQEFPEPVANRILEKMNEVAKSNAPQKEVYEELS